MTAAAAITIAAVAGISPGMMTQVAETGVKVAAAAPDLNADRQAIAVQRPSVAALTATVVTIAEIAPSSIVHRAFAIRMAGATVIEVRTKIAAAIRDVTEIKIRIATKTAAVIEEVIVAVTGDAIEIVIKIAWATGAGIKIRIGIGIVTATKTVTVTDIAIVIGMAGTAEITIAIAMVTRFTM